MNRGRCRCHHPAACSVDDPNYGVSLSALCAFEQQRARRCCSHLALRLAGNGQEELELGRELILSVEPIGEVDSANTAVGVDLNSKSSKEIWAIKD